MTKKKKEKELVKVKTEVKYLPISPIKLGLIAKAVRNLSPEEALRRLVFLSKKGARFLRKGIKTAVADAEHNFGLDKESLEFEEIIVNQGPGLKRRDRHHGARFNGGLIKKPRTHLVIKIKGRKK